VLPRTNAGTIAAMEPSGYELRTRRPRVGAAPSRHRLAGPRASHPDLQFAACPSCGVSVSPIFRLDFTDLRLLDLGRWDGLLVTLTCHNGCVDLGPWWWDHAIATAPISLEAPPPPRGPRLVEDCEFEMLEIMLGKPRRRSQGPRVGGDPPIDEIGRALEMPEDTSPACLRCGELTRLLAQWTEIGSHDVPQRIGKPGILGEPGWQRWFGCRACRLVAMTREL
jgi:hypothetical protein